MTYFLLPRGCQMNISDSERIGTVLESIGYTRTDKEEEADILGVVACSVRQKAIDRVYSRIHKWNAWKRDRPILTILSGCILPADRTPLAERFDVVFAIEEVESLPEMIRRSGTVTPASPRGAMPDIRTGFWRIEPHYGSSIEAYVPIQNGCDKFCTFCAVPYTRGREISRPSGEILREIENLVERGYRSITLLGQNVNSYGFDRRSTEIGFPALLREVGTIVHGHQVWVYFTSPHPRDMTPHVLEAIAEFPELANQIHLPIQSGDDDVLSRMNRNYTLEDYRSVVTNIRTILPEATLFTDIIVGFSGESEEQFLRTRDAMEEFSFQMAYIAMYSPRPGAQSARWEDDVPQEEKKRRYHALSEVLVTHAAPYTASLVGKTVPVLLTGFSRKEGFLDGHTEGRIPVRVPLRPRGATSSPGEVVSVGIASSRPLSIAGEPV